MKEINLKGLNQKIYKETTSNNLDIYMIPYENKEGFIVEMVTKYGSNDIEFIPKDKNEYKRFPLGIAHFLEHKLFEQKDGIDPFVFAAERGLDCNAGTSNDSTVYYFSGNDKFNETLDYLLSFIYDINLTEENIEKEKGIIIEELNMYLDNVDFRTELELKNMVYHNHPNKEDIGGTVETVKSITKEDLLECYDTFYQPSNMFLVIAGKFNIDEALKIINKNELLNNRISNIKIDNKKIEEPLVVKEKYKEIYENVTNTKLCFSIKIPYTDKDKYIYRSYINNFFSIKIGSISEFQCRLKNEKKLDQLGFYLEKADELLVINIFIETDDYEYVIKELEKELSNKKIEEEDFKRQKKVLISRLVGKTDFFNAMADEIVNDVINYQKFYDSKTDLIRSLNIDEFSSIIENIDFTNRSVLVVKPKENK